MTRFLETSRFAADSLAWVGRSVHRSRHRLTRLRRTSHDLPGAFAPSLVRPDRPRCVPTRRAETWLPPPVLAVNACASDALSRSARYCALRWFLPAERSRVLWITTA